MASVPRPSMESSSSQRRPSVRDKGRRQPSQVSPQTTPQSSLHSTLSPQDHEISFWEQFNILEFKTIALENKGSVARDHMANERTFLAWMRTSLSFITIGIGVTQLFRLQDKDANSKSNNDSHALKRFGKPLGSVFVILGIITLVFGSVRFFKVQRMLTRNYYPATRLALVLLIATVLIIILITLVVVLKTSIRR